MRGEAAIMPLPIQEILAVLVDEERPLSSSNLARLSGLEPESLRLFQMVWPSIATSRKRIIVTRLVELAEDHSTLDYENIFTNCLNDRDSEVRSRAIEGLWEIEEPCLVDILVNMMESDSSQKVRSSAATALGKFTMMAVEQKMRPEYTLKIYCSIINALNDINQPVEVKRRALESLSCLDSPEIRKLIDEAYHSNNHKLRASSIYAMGKNCDSSWLPLLLNEATSNDTEIRYEVAVALGELGERESVSCLIELAADPDIEVKLAAIRSLGHTGDAGAKNFLVKLRNESGDTLKQATEEALREIGILGEGTPLFWY